MRKVNFFYVGDCGPNFYIACRVVYLLWRTAPFVLLFIGTFGNIFNIIILSQQQMRKHSTSIYILILAAAELTLLWTFLVPDTIFGILGIQSDDQSPIICRLRRWIALTAGAFSTWILVLLTIERTLLAKAPVFSRNKLSPRNSFVVAISFLVIIALANSHMIFGWRLFSIPRNAQFGLNLTNNSNNHTPFPCYFSSTEYKQFYNTKWFVIILIVYNIVPATIIIIGNVNIALILFVKRKRQVRVNPTSSANQVNNVTRVASAKLLLILSAFYIITTMPWCIYYVARGQMTDQPIEKAFAEWQLITVIVHILLWCNFSFNFFFYFVSGTLFKNEWNRLVSKTKITFQRSRLTTTTRF